MPHHKSCIKRVKTNEKARQRNKIQKSAIKTVEKKLSKASKEDTAKVVNELCSVTDNAVRKGVLHKKKGARIKSKAQKLVATA